jgi:hypothetical protein
MCMRCRFVDTGVIPTVDRSRVARKCLLMLCQHVTIFAPIRDTIACCLSPSKRLLLCICPLVVLCLFFASVLSGVVRRDGC